MSEINKNTLRLAGITVILASIVLPGSTLDALADIAIFGLFADWGYRLLAQNRRLK
jgi:hypothetical protein